MVVCIVRIRWAEKKVAVELVYLLKVRTGAKLTSRVLLTLIM